MTSIKVQLGARSYDILVGSGILRCLRKEIEARLEASQVFIITSPRIRRLHGAELLGCWDR